MSEYEDIEEIYEYDYEMKKTSVRYFPDRSIATVTTTGGDLGDLETEVLWEGMSQDEVIEHFPPTANAKKLGAIVNLAKLVRSIMYEASEKEGVGLEPGNVRNFWYTHLKHIITKTMGLAVTDSVNQTINQAWGEMINSGMVTYEGMNILGGKESSRHSIVKDSPFSNLIIAVEKVDFFDMFKWLPELFNCTLITAGGQPSRAVARTFIRQLGELHVDLNQDFFMCVASDLDPAGYYIQEAFRKQFESAIQFYGGDGRVVIKRLFVRKYQVSPQLLEAEAVPCTDKANTEKAMKAENTKWEFFCGETDGGIYIPAPPGWKARTAYIDGKGVKRVQGKGEVYDIGGVPHVRALLEMNAFGKSIIEKAIIQELLSIILETSDETKIMIPEIMRIFELMRQETSEEIYLEWHEKIIKPLIDLFLSDTNRWDNEINRKYYDERQEAKDQRDEQLQPIEEKYDDLQGEKDQEMRDRVPELYEEKDSLEDQIEKLQAKLEAVDEDIEDKCSDIIEEKDRLDEEREEEEEPIHKEYNEEVEDINLRKTYRQDKLKTFRDEHATVFNPIEMALKHDIEDALGVDEDRRPPELQYFFTDLEEKEEFQPHIGRLLTDPDQLIEGEVSCFDQSAPTFTEEDLLKKASQRKDNNVESVRNAFAPAFTDEMKTLIRTHVDGVEFEARGVVEDVDLKGEVQKAIDETEDEIDRELWKEDEDQDEEDYEDEDEDDYEEEEEE